MKGLLIKDIMLMKNQKQSMAFMFMMGILFMFMGDDVSMGISFVTTMFSIFSITIISYDEFDNGMSFLFTLPVNRVKYVIEKYIFGILICLTGYIGISVFAGIISVIRGIEFPFLEYLEVGAGGFVAAIMLISFMIPVQLKFGAEKSRIAMIGVVGISVALGYVLVKIMHCLNVDVEAIFEMIENIRMGILVLFMIILLIIIITISYIVSIKIMRKKEF